MSFIGEQWTNEIVAGSLPHDRTRSLVSSTAHGALTDHPFVGFFHTDFGRAMLGQAKARELGRCLSRVRAQWRTGGRIDPRFHQVFVLAFVAAAFKREGIALDKNN